MELGEDWYGGDFAGCVDVHFQEDCRHHEEDTEDDREHHPPGHPGLEESFFGFDFAGHHIGCFGEPFISELLGFDLEAFDFASSLEVVATADADGRSGRQGSIAAWAEDAFAFFQAGRVQEDRHGVLSAR